MQFAVQLIKIVILTNFIIGDIKGSIKHFIAAVLHSAQGYQLLQVLQSTMPPEAYKMLMEALPKAQAKITQVISRSFA